MNYMDKWNIIVDQFNKNRKSKENEVQILWENIFSQIFDYSKLLGFLDAQKSYQIVNPLSYKMNYLNCNEYYFSINAFKKTDDLQPYFKNCFYIYWIFKMLLKK